MTRSSGVLLHISSLPGDFGIGSFGKSAYQFVDFLVETGQSYWQILPLGTTSYGDSPYQSFSAFAGNTYFIDFELLTEEGLLKHSDYKDVDFGKKPHQVNYGQLFKTKRPVLELAVKNFLKRNQLGDYHHFVNENQTWLVPFAEYMAIKESFDNEPWYNWDEPIRMREESALSEYRAKLSDDIIYHQVTQYFFFSQWQLLKNYANNKHIQIIGDIPIYVSRDSVEMWSDPQLFKVDEDHNPTVVSGTPPDYFSEDGQYWGNPIYDWEYMRNNGYQWWIQRLKESFKLYDVVRIDHFRGFESYWEVPFGEKTAQNGRWKKGPGIELFNAIYKELGELNIIAEDLGFMTQEVIDMRDATGFPGMKILQFGFTNEDSIDLPHNYLPNTIAYVGTHDNETAEGWIKDTAEPQIIKQANQYTHRKSKESISSALNRTLAASVSNTVIYTMQDLLGLDNSARMNTPSTIGQNWQWRLKGKKLDPKVAKELTKITRTYFRFNPANDPLLKLKKEEEKIQEAKENTKDSKDVTNSEAFHSNVDSSSI
ncbi:4-alpha-glucanotransferase [Fundicoccus culcitae]|uniref:4-alpha-glucanotransferase n=1 Tax=Fundicoccus culcitae TaxID=2969821 RepID=A0ABY5P5N8_9LACT|nr:4-alpha-glucanotransferase [Fundicoccus culcitae]UUX33925.1 4-alpha-glucanotransferase [Fundicoccus culcitae]